MKSAEKVKAVGEHSFEIERMCDSKPAQKSGSINQTHTEQVKNVYILIVQIFKKYKKFQC